MCFVQLSRRIIASQMLLISGIGVVLAATEQPHVAYQQTSWQTVVQAETKLVLNICALS